MLVRIRYSLHSFIILQSSPRSCKWPVILRFAAKIHALVTCGTTDLILVSLHEMIVRTERLCNTLARGSSAS